MNDNKNNTPKRLYRSAVDRKICGVCGGHGRRISDIDSTLVRLALRRPRRASASPPASWLYILAAIVMPDEPEN